MTDVTVVKQETINLPTKQEENKSCNGFTYTPATFEAALSWCESISRSNIVPECYRTPKGASQEQSKAMDVYIACSQGQELGMKPLQALNNIIVINGRPSLTSKAKLAIALKYCVVSYSEDESDGVPKWTVNMKRKDGSSNVTRTYSVYDAITAGTMKIQKMGDKSYFVGTRGAWVGYWKQMLFWKAVSQAADASCADILSGFDTTEDLKDIEYSTPTEQTITQTVLNNNQEENEVKEIELQSSKKTEDRLVNSLLKKNNKKAVETVVEAEQELGLEVISEDKL